MNKNSLRRGSEPKMVRGNSNFLLLPYQIKKSVMMMRKQRRVSDQGYNSNPELQDLHLDIFKDSFNFDRFQPKTIIMIFFI